MYLCMLMSSSTPSSDIFQAYHIHVVWPFEHSIRMYAFRSHVLCMSYLIMLHVHAVQLKSSIVVCTAAENPMLGSGGLLRGAVDVL